MPHPIPPLEYCTSGDVQFSLRSDVYPPLPTHIYHGAVDVVNFLRTPMLPEVRHVEEGKELEPPFPQSSASETPWMMRRRTAADDEEDDSAFEHALLDHPVLAYILNATILLTVQAFILVPSVFPTGLKYAQRAVQLVLAGLAVSSAAHAAGAFMRAPPSAPGELARALLSPAPLTPALAHLAIAALGGAIVGAAAALCANAAVLGRTVYRLAVGAVGAAVPSPSPPHAGGLLRDVATALLLVPAGLAAQCWECRTLPQAALRISGWNTVQVALAGVAVLHGVRWARACFQRAAAAADEGSTGLRRR